jgi:glycogen synthase
MRIAMLGWEFPPFVSGGLGVHCFELTLRMAKMGHKVDFYMPTCNKELHGPHENIRLFEVAETVLKPYLSYTKKGKLATYGKDLLKAVDSYNKYASSCVAQQHLKNPYDLVHAHDWLTAKGGHLVAERIQRSLVQSIHSTEFDRTSWPWDAILNIERQGVKYADLVIAVSNRTKEQVKRLGAPEQKIRVVYNGVDSVKYKGQNGRLKLMNHYKDKKIVLFLGRLTEQKGPVQFLHAAKKVLEKDKYVLFFIGGAGEMLPLLINLSLELGISKNVKFLGFLPDVDQKRIYSASDVYVMPSTSEPFGIVALEAMASGTPVIISKTSGVGEVVKSALKVDFWDINGMAQKILAVLKYKPLKHAMVRMADEDLKHLTWENCAQNTIDVYNEAILVYNKKVAEQLKVRDR